MTMLADTDRRLLVEIACAGVNHGYRRQVRAMLPALPYLVPDESLRAACHAFLLFGLDEIGAARGCLAQATGPEAETLGAILQYHHGRDR
ncbi:EscG/YscG/SsaH family type III secretion system needle protein co-chaperone [Candidatus Sodalis sp. SoCistrobi]|uniref:EscG/YscG/SsaH family type III secretion system needle protein co-chaperone n=1 Tax=Candidatus Sodalis sp. SoCistrobi TaxID=1922216 RepID=UPI00093EC9FF|nr:EscG/YscG/SsaH family type III secretion system needle protein co-chaperone [Candidatus Sodalis sp. SoCistrobi]